MLGRRGAGGVCGSGIAMVVDSGCDVPEDFARRYGIRTVPLQLTYPDGSAYEDGVDITSDEVYARMPAEIPTTSLPGAAGVLAAVREAREQGCRHIVAVTISGALSGTHALFERLLPQRAGMDCLVVDSKSIGIGAGVVAVVLARAIESGVPFEELAGHAADVVRDSGVVLTVSNLDCLVRGGRLSRAKGAVGSLLSVRPLITCDDEGALAVAAQVRGTRKALTRMADMAAEGLAGFEGRVVAVAHAQAPELADELSALVQARLPGVAVMRSRISAALGVHTGPTCVGVTWLGLR